MTTPSYAGPSSSLEPTDYTALSRPAAGPAGGDRAGEPLLRRALAAAGLLGIALVHLLDVPGKLEETPYLGVAYLGLIVTAVALVEVLLRQDRRVVWAGVGLLAAATMIGFVLSRTTGLPGASDDIGNWAEPLGVASLFVEGVVVLLAGTALARSGTER
jgi:hypothetical protein